jgi:hypothetical protein
MRRRTKFGGARRRHWADPVQSLGGVPHFREYAAYCILGESKRREAGMRLHTAIALALMLAATPALACTGQSVHLAGDFKSGDLGWGQEDASFKLAGPQADFTPQPGTQTARWNTAVSLTDLDACVTVAMPATTTDASQTYAGLLFWLTDKDNFYEVVVAANGLFTVARKVRGKIAAAAPVPWTKADTLKLGADAKNTLRVTIEGQTVTIRINDSEVARFRGQAPEVPSHIGLVAASPPGTTDTWRLSDLKVTNVSAPAVSDAAGAKESISTGTVAAAAACADGKVLFEDGFTSQDPTWGPKDARLNIAGGEAVLSPVPGTRTFRWNRVFVFDDVDACATIRLAKPTSDSTASYAGLMFWVEDNRNYYQAVIAPNGYFTVARVVNGVVEAKRPVDWVKLDAVKTGAKEKNTLRVTAKGADVTISVNGKQVADFKGEPPKGPSYIGMLAASAPSKGGDDWSISDFRVTAPQ